jgi:hypothetical protein
VRFVLRRFKGYRSSRRITYTHFGHLGFAAATGNDPDYMSPEIKALLHKQGCLDLNYSSCFTDFLFPVSPQNRQSI